MDVTIVAYKASKLVTVDLLMRKTALLKLYKGGRVSRMAPQMRTARSEVVGADRGIGRILVSQDMVDFSYFAVQFQLGAT